MFFNDCQFTWASNNDQNILNYKAVFQRYKGWDQAKPELIEEQEDVY